MKGEDAVREIAKATGGEIKEMGRLPDGSGFAIMSMPLKKDHWIFQGSGRDDSPAPLRMGEKTNISFVIKDPNSIWERGWTGDRRHAQDFLREAFRYAIRGATMHGAEMDFDPDALVQNLMVGLFGYGTEDGYSHLKWSDEQEPGEPPNPPVQP